MRKSLYLSLIVTLLISGCTHVQDIVDDWPKIEDGELAPTPDPDITPVELGKVSIVGKQWFRGGEPITWVAKAIDIFNDPTDFSDFKTLVDKDADRGFNLYVTYAGPGLGKPFNVGNGSGSPYTDTYNLVRNEAYWQEATDRIRYCNAKGITVLCSYSFVDQGMLNPNKVNQHKLNEEIQRWAQWLDRYSVILSPVSEADEGGSSGISRTLDILRFVRAFTTAPVGFHTTSNNSKWAGEVDFISVQDNGSVNWEKIKKLVDQHTIPVIIVENQHVSDDKACASFRRANDMSATYTLTNRGQTISEEMKLCVKSYASSVR